MPSFSRGDVVRVPFPYTDGHSLQNRPALIVSNGPVGDNGLLVWVVMITSAQNRPWPGDVSLGDAYEEVGLPAPSVIRPTKIAAIETKRADPIGHLPDALMAKVDQTIAGLLGR
jgi:mRNA interferase MazF